MPINLDRLLKLRVVVGRIGEMDDARWWNTTGQLGSLGRMALKRGFPRTHYFAQARSVFAVAKHRCREVFNPPGCVTLWSLPETTEEEFDARWEHWLDRAQTWEAFFQQVEAVRGADLAAILAQFSLVHDQEMETFARLRRSSEGRAVLLPGIYAGADSDITLLALGFARGEVGAPAIPYQRREDGV
jgi:hypothetical protein